MVLCSERFNQFDRIECACQAAQHQYQPTGGIRTARRSLFCAQTNSVKSASSRPAHRRVTQTVGRTSPSRKGDNMMHPFWLILGTVIILMGIFNNQLLRLLKLMPMSEVIITPYLKHSSRKIEIIARWLGITLGVSFLVLGLGGVLPKDISYKVSFSLLGLSGLMVLSIIGITLANWKAK